MRPSTKTLVMLVIAIVTAIVLARSRLAFGQGHGEPGDQRSRSTAWQCAQVASSRPNVSARSSQDAAVSARFA